MWSKIQKLRDDLNSSSCYEHGHISPFYTFFSRSRWMITPPGLSNPETVLTHSNYQYGHYFFSFYQLIQDQRDNFFYFHRDCIKSISGLVTFYEEGWYFSLFLHFIKIKSTCGHFHAVHYLSTSPYERSWHILTYSTMSALSSISSNLQRFDTLLD